MRHEQPCLLYTSGKARGFSRTLLILYCAVIAFPIIFVVMTSFKSTDVYKRQPLMQFVFLESLIDAAKRDGHHIALETTGFAPWEIAEKIFQKTDLILYDVKHMDSLLHREYTGVPNEQILENLYQTAKNDYPLVMRIPLIKGFNATRENIEATARMAAEHEIGRVDPVSYTHLQLLRSHKNWQMTKR